MNHSEARQLLIAKCLITLTIKGVTLYLDTYGPNQDENVFTPDKKHALRDLCPRMKNRLLVVQQFFPEARLVLAS